MEVPKLEQREHSEAEDKNPRLPAPELVLTCKGKNEEFNATLGEEEAHP